MSYNPVFEASKALPVKRIAKQLEEFAAVGQNLSRTRFSRSPPSVPSVPSTTYDESNPPSPGEQLRDREIMELQNSTAGGQFAIQLNDELDRICIASERGLLQQPRISDREEAARANVRYRWMRQGIWDDRWDMQLSKIWKHESQDPPKRTNPSKSANEGKLETEKKRKRFDLQDEYQEIVRSSVDFQSRQWSRPCYQFVHQFCEERQWIKMGFGRHGQDQPFNQEQPSCLDTKAYENVRSRWIRDGIWDDNWTIIPGVTWKHERPQTNLPPRDVLCMADAHKAARMEQAEPRPDWYFMAPIEPLLRGNQDLSPKFPFEYASDPPASNKAMPSSERPRLQDMKAKNFEGTGLLISTHQSNAKAKSNVKSHKHDERPTTPPTKKSIMNTKRTKRKGKPAQKQEDNATKSRTVKSRQLKGRVPAKSPHLVQDARITKSTGAPSSRPRRTAASRALEKLTKRT